MSPDLRLFQIFYDDASRACFYANVFGKVSGEILNFYEKKSCPDSSLQPETFTGLKRVEIENAVEDMREKLDSQRVGS